MIIVGVSEAELAKKITNLFDVSGIVSKIVDPGSITFLSELYHEEVVALVIDSNMAPVSKAAMIDIANMVSSRMPVFLIIDEENYESTENLVLSDFEQCSTRVSMVNRHQLGQVLATIKSLHGQAHFPSMQTSQFIPLYHRQIPAALLKCSGALGVLTIDASNLNKISVEYGSDVYYTAKQVFHDVLMDLWGRPGAFRDSDLICRSANASNVYYIFMNSSRKTGSLPHPGVLERVADRLANTIYNALWSELDGTGNGGRLPSCLQTVPLIGVGFSGILDNPCMSMDELVETGLEASKKMAQAQLRRSRERQRELMQTLIQSEEILIPHYQGIFNLKGLKKEHVEKAQNAKSIKPLQQFIFGFEALIRVNKSQISTISSFSGGLDFQYLKPEVLFSLAKQTKVALELDQACMRLAAIESKGLPGVLMVNVLPRNLYHIDRLKNYFSDVDSVMLEVSESEAISNQEMMLRARDYLASVNIQIAADDFGRGYSSLERIIRVRPNVIKFDRSMVHDIDKDKVKEAYVRGLIQAAKILNTTILAEGVECWEEAAVLRDMGVDLIQGFLFHCPESCSKILQQLNKATKAGNLETVA